jgi:hypothetical protein
MSHWVSKSVGRHSVNPTSSQRASTSSGSGRATTARPAARAPLSLRRTGSRGGVAPSSSPESAAAAPLTAAEEEARFHDAYSKASGCGCLVCSCVRLLPCLDLPKRPADALRPLPTKQLTPPSPTPQPHPPSTPTLNPQAYTVSQLYNINRPPPIPPSEYEARRKKNDLEDVLAVGAPPAWG